MSGFDGNIEQAADQLIPLKGIFQSPNANLMINALEIIAENEVNTFTIAGNSFKAFAHLLSMLQDANTNTLNSNLLYRK